MANAILTGVNTSGSFFTTLESKNNYNITEMDVMHKVVSNLLAMPTASNKPGILLGNLQSGKTRSIIGTMAVGFDNGYDIVIIFIKNSSGLVKQTYECLEQEYETLIDEDKLAVYDIMKMPMKLRNFELKKKLVIVLKKEKTNIGQLERMLFEQYSELNEKLILFIDDEADFASVAYDNIKEKNIIELKKIAGQIDEIRARLNNASYLQVTATPYSLYLQPEDMTIHPGKVYQPKRPAFTEFVPIHDKYVGGEMYFESSKIDGHMASYLFYEIQDKELKLLTKSDKRKVKAETLLTSDRYLGIRSAIINFIVGGKVRNIQQEVTGEKLEKYAFVIHTMTSKAAHHWQEDVVSLIEEKLVEAMYNERPLFEKLILEAYDNLERSKMDGLIFPTFDEVLSKVEEALSNEELLIEIVNSEKDVENLLDKSGQLKLRTPLNLFIGGKFLDRGITIGNLIGIYYGRKPQKFQQDIVLEHSLMYGARALPDIAVTRFYTTQRIYNGMERMHEFDTELRRAFENGANDGAVVFIQKDIENKVIPCNTNKIVLSSINMLKPGKRLLPVGFQTIAKTMLDKKMKKIDELVHNLKSSATTLDSNDHRNFLVNKEDIVELLTLIHETYKMEEQYEWDLSMYFSMLNYLSEEQDSNFKGKVWIVLTENRDISRFKQSGKFEDSPDTSQLKVARDLAEDIPALILTRQNGAEEKGWKGSPFYWPVLVAPQNINTTVFANRVLK